MELLTPSKLLQVVTKTADYTITAADDVIKANAASGAITLTLPSAVGIAGKVIRVVTNHNSANLVTVQTVLSQKIGVNQTNTILLGADEISLVSDGANWQWLSSPMRTIILQINSAGNSVSVNYPAAVATPSKLGTGNYRLTFTSGIFKGAIIGVVIPYAAGHAYITNNSTTVLDYQCINTSNAATDMAHIVHISGLR